MVGRDVGWRRLRLERDEDYETRKLSLVGAIRRNKEESMCYAILTYALFLTVGNNRKKGGNMKESFSFIIPLINISPLI